MHERLHHFKPLNADIFKEERFLKSKPPWRLSSWKACFCVVNEGQLSMPILKVHKPLAQTARFHYSRICLTDNDINTDNQ